MNREAICIEGGAKRTLASSVIPAQAGISFAFLCHPERSEGSGLAALKLHDVRLRACRILLNALAEFSPAASHFS
ncbi:hypothetical protein [Nevskia soli]|uniref:hypothetical protein n=1 Tax=Nevskia soli TaxID=418856 RepID=UPI0012F84C7B|nr:hypothetical protein [Nevskia soli]